MTCHSQLWTNAEMLAPVRASLADNKPIAWHRVNKLPGLRLFRPFASISPRASAARPATARRSDAADAQAAPLTWTGASTATAIRPRRCAREAVFDPDWKPPATTKTGRKLVAGLSHPHRSPHGLLDMPPVNELPVKGFRNTTPGARSRSTAVRR